MPTTLSVPAHSGKLHRIATPGAAMLSPHPTTATLETPELGEFLRGVSHEFANLLNAVAMNAEIIKVLLDRGNTTVAREALDQLLADCTRCTRLVQSFQYFGTALQPSPSERVSADLLLQSAIAQMQGELPDTGISFHIVGATASELEIDVPAWTSALAGLLRNAAEAGATTIDMSVVATATDRLRVDVADNGSGIESCWSARVTEPFFTTRRAQGAAGLGLTLAQELVRRHAGALLIHSEGHNRGTTVSIELPRR